MVVMFSGAESIDEFSDPIDLLWIRVTTNFNELPKLLVGPTDCPDLVELGPDTSPRDTASN